MSEEDRPQKQPRRLSRREFFGVAGAGALATGVLAGVRIRRRGKVSGIVEAAEPPPVAQGYRNPVHRQITLNVNGADYTIEVDTRDSLANALRERLHLTGTHVCCDRGECGACTVVVDGRAVYSCSVLAVSMQGKKILTVEGLAQGDKLHPVQQAFIECDGFQCGYCTAGQMMAMTAMLMKNPSPTEDDVRTAMSGNICRCGAYPGILKAGLRAAQIAKGG